MGDYLVFNLNLNLNLPPPCTTGFLPAQQQRAPSLQDYPDRPQGDLYCRVPQDAPFNVCGARNTPCTTVPGKRAPTVKMCESDEQYIPLNDATTGRATRTRRCRVSRSRSFVRVRSRLPRRRPRRRLPHRRARRSPRPSTTRRQGGTWDPTVRCTRSRTSPRVPRASDPGSRCWSRRPDLPAERGLPAREIAHERVSTPHSTSRWNEP